jgi:hypothetical protein
VAESYTPSEDSSKFKVRIPNYDAATFEPARTIPVDESLVVAAQSDDMDSRKRAPWVNRFNSVQRARTGYSPLASSIDFFEEQLKAAIDPEVMRRRLKDPDSAAGLDALLTRYIERTGISDEVVAELGMADPQPNRYSDPVRVEGDGSRGSAYYVYGKAYRFTDLLLDDSATEAQRLRVVALHSESLQEAQAELDRQQEQLKIWFDEGLEAAVASGILPESAIPPPNSSRARRIENVRLLVIDPALGGEISADFTAVTNAAGVKANQVYNNNVLFRNYSHELFHAHSGVTVLLHDPTGDEDDYDIFEGLGQDGVLEDVRTRFASDPNMYLLNVTHVGLADKDNTFYAVNEAYTEWAAMQIGQYGYEQGVMWDDFVHNHAQDILGGMSLDGDKEFDANPMDSYLAERILLAGLSAHGIGMDIIGEAYFESYEPKGGKDKREVGQGANARWKLDTAIAAATPYKSLRQLLNALSQDFELNATNRTPEQKSWYMAARLAEILGDLEN